jgi:hypothetical protein
LPYRTFAISPAPKTRSVPIGTFEIAKLAAAYEAAPRMLGLSDRSDPKAEIIARKIIAIAKTGELDPRRLTERAIEGYFRYAANQGSYVRPSHLT